ncbi:MAG: DUF1566 domain-containing protein [Proteobacteria bacterium]|nr:DUF1566 domain-containing protein [Pseudomonadota bacterium]MBU1688363.1 DUF1566 domain-containing protein [Pseudomonadota bacterium]
MFLHKMIRFVSAGVFIALFGAGCGGGGGDSTTTTTSNIQSTTTTLASTSTTSPVATTTTTLPLSNVAPVARAGADQSVAVGDTVILDGINSYDANGDSLSYSWVLWDSPSGSNSQIANDTSPQAYLVIDVAGAYKIQLIVDDGTLASVADSLLIMASGPSLPQAKAGADQWVLTGSDVNLDGSASSSPEGSILQYSWAILSMPEGSLAALTSTDTVSSSFNADVDGTYIVQLTVSDGVGSGIPDTLAIVVSSLPVVVNFTPVSEAGIDQTVAVGDVVMLDGSGSSDGDGDPLTYDWTLIAPNGSNSVLINPFTSAPSFDADVIGTYTVQLIVNDGTQSSSTDSAVITAIYTVIPVLTGKLPDSGQTTSYTSTFGEDSDYTFNSPSFRDNGDGTVTDNITGLLWQQSDDGTLKTWEDAFSYCADLTLAVYADWRLPVTNELFSLVDFGTDAPAIDATFFPQTKSAEYWATSTGGGILGGAWRLDFDDGSAISLGRDGSLYVRCVYDGR